MNIMTATKTRFIIKHDLHAGNPSAIIVFDNGAEVMRLQGKHSIYLAGLYILNIDSAVAKPAMEAAMDAWRN